MWDTRTLGTTDHSVNLYKLFQIHGSLVVFNGIKYAQTYDQVIWLLPTYPRTILADFVREVYVGFHFGIVWEGGVDDYIVCAIRAVDRWQVMDRCYGILWSLEKKQTQCA